MWFRQIQDLHVVQAKRYANLVSTRYLGEKAYDRYYRN